MKFCVSRDSCAPVTRVEKRTLRMLLLMRPQACPSKAPTPFLTSPPLQQQLKSRACLSKVQAITTHGDSFAASTEQTEVRKNC